MFSKRVNKNSFISRMIRFPLWMFGKSKAVEGERELPKTTCGYFFNGVFFATLNIILIIGATLFSIGVVEGIGYWFNEVFNWEAEYKPIVSYFFLGSLPLPLTVFSLYGMLVGLGSPFIITIIIGVFSYKRYKTNIDRGLTTVFTPVFASIGDAGYFVYQRGKKVTGKLCKPLEVED